MKQKIKNEILEKDIVRKAEILINEASIKRPPVNLELVASLCDIRKIHKVNMEISGKLVPLLEGGAEVFLNKRDHEKRRNFTLAHEITHTFFPDYKLKPQTRIDESVGNYDPNNWVEYLCDAGASKLLMPDKFFKNRFDEYKFSINSLLKLSNLFNSSLQATGIKMVQQNPSSTAIVVWTNKRKPIEKRLMRNLQLPGLEVKPLKKLRVEFSYGFENITFIPKNKSLEESNGLISDSFFKKRKLRGKDNIKIGSRIIEVNIETLPIKSSESILTLLSYK